MSSELHGMGLGRFQLNDDGKREIAPRLPLPQPDRSASPELKSGAAPAQPISPNILRNAGNDDPPTAARGLLVTPQRAGVSASVTSPTRPLVPVASVTASVEVEPSTTSSKPARRLSNPRLAAQAASRVAEAAAKAAARGRLYSLEAVKAIARGNVLDTASLPAQPSLPPGLAEAPALAANRPPFVTATGSLSATQAAVQHALDQPTVAAPPPAADMVSQTGASESVTDRSVSLEQPQTDGAEARPAARPPATRSAELLGAAEPPMQQAVQPVGDPAVQACISDLSTAACARSLAVTALGGSNSTADTLCQHCGRPPTPLLAAQARVCAH